MYEVTVTKDGTDYLYTSPGVGGIPDYYVRVNPDDTIRFGLGSLNNAPADMPPTQPYDLGPHHVKVVRIDDGTGVRTTLVDDDIQYHGWFQSWVYRPNGLPTPKKTPAQLVAARRTWPMGDVVKTGLAPMQVSYSPVKVRLFDFGGACRYQPTTGERPDIGWVTDVIANYLMGGSAVGLIAWAEAILAAPIHVLDKKTGRWVDPNQYPHANTYGNDGHYQGGPWIAIGVFDNGWPTPAPKAAPINIQRAHLAEMCGWAAIITEDWTYLEEAQALAIIAGLNDINGTDPAFGGAMVGTSEVRGMGHHLRQVLLAYIATKDAEARVAAAGKAWPPSAHPSATFKKIIDNSLGWWLKFCNDPLNQTFHTVSSTSREGPWQHNYVLTELPLALLFGLPEWAPVYKFLLKNWIDQTSGKSGWPPGFGTDYYFNVAPTTPPDPTLDFVGQALWRLNESHIDGSKRFASWGEAWAARVQSMKDERTASNLGGIPAGDPAEAAAIAKTQAEWAAIDAQAAKLAADPLNGGQAMQGFGYNLTTCAVGNIASYLDKMGIFPTRQEFPDFDTCLKNVRDYVNDGGWMDPRVSIVDDPALAGSSNLKPIIEAGQPAPPSTDPGTPPPPAPNEGVNEPPPETGDATTRIYTTSKDSVFIDVTGKVPPGSWQLICDITGNGKTDAFVVWRDLGQVGWMKFPPELQSIDTAVAQESHASGDTLPFRGCRSLTINGGKIWSKIVTDPVPDPVPDPTPEPTPDPVPVHRTAQSLLDEVKELVPKVKAVVGRLS